MNSYALQPMESNSLRGYSVQTVHSVKLKFSMYIINHPLTFCIDFDELRIYSFLREYEKEFSCITAYGVKL